MNNAFINQELLNQQLLKAIELENIKKAKQLLKDGADVNWGQGILLSRAVHANNIKAVNLLLDYNALINTNDGDALKRAIGIGNMEIVRTLINRGADPSASNNEACYNACNLGRLDELKFLLEKGASLGDTFFRLTEAAENGRLNIVRFLIEEKGVYFGYKSMVPMKGASSADHEHVVQYLLNHMFSKEEINQKKFKVIQAYLDKKHYPLLKKSFLLPKKTFNKLPENEEFGL